VNIHTPYDISPPVRHRAAKSTVGIPVVIHTTVNDTEKCVAWVGTGIVRCSAFRRRLDVAGAPSGSSATAAAAATSSSDRVDDDPGFRKLKTAVRMNAGEEEALSKHMDEVRLWGGLQADLLRQEKEAADRLAREMAKNQARRVRILYYPSSRLFRFRYPPFRLGGKRDALLSVVGLVRSPVVRSLAHHCVPCGGLGSCDEMRRPGRTRCVAHSAVLSHQTLEYVPNPVSANLSPSLNRAPGGGGRQAPCQGAQGARACSAGQRAGGGA